MFIVHATDAVLCDQVYDLLYARLPPPPNLSTLPVSNHVCYLQVFSTLHIGNDSVT